MPPDPAPGAPPAGQQASTTPPPIPLPSWFTEIDVNKKGEVTRADFLKYRMKSFEQLDANKDGQLTEKEATQLPAISQRFKELDKDQSGALSPSEFEKGLLS
mgnify:CR=1 FL=1